MLLVALLVTELVGRLAMKPVVQVARVVHPVPALVRRVVQVAIVVVVMVVPEDAILLVPIVLKLAMAAAKLLVKQVVVRMVARVVAKAIARANVQQLAMAIV